MPKFLMFVEEQKTVVRCKEFEAEDMEEAIGMVEADEWTEENNWDESDSSGSSEIRDDLCYQLADNPRQKGDDDGQEYGDPRDEREERLKGDL